MTTCLLFLLRVCRCPIMNLCVRPNGETDDAPDVDAGEIDRGDVDDGGEA